MREDKIIEVSCLVLINTGNQVFVVQRPEGKSLGGYWEFPGGKIEIGESAEDALRREIVEELNLELGELKALAETTYVYDFATIRLWPFWASCEKIPNITLHEHSAMEWVDMGRAHELNWAPADIPIMHELQKMFSV
jgi:8-oxo-dGTP diphosphatase